MINRLVFRNFLEDEDEKVMFVFRRPFVITWYKLLFQLLIWGGIAGLVLWYDYDWEYYPLLELIVLVIAVLKISGVFWRWWVNAIVMTTEGLIFVTWPKYFHRSYERIDFVNLDEITVTRVGLRAFTMNYGTLTFQKSNGGDPVTWQRISSPHKVARRIEHYREIMLNQKNFTEESALKDLLSQMVQTHVGDSGQPERFEDSGYKRKEKKLFGRRTVPTKNTNTTTESGPEEIIEAEEEERLISEEKLLHKLQEIGALKEFDPEEEVEETFTKPSQKKKIRKKRPDDELDIEVEKQLDDRGGLEMDLD